MPESKVGNFLEQNQGGEITPEVSQTILRSVLEDLLEAPGIGDVVSAWFKDYWSLKSQQTTESAAPPTHSPNPYAGKEGERPTPAAKPGPIHQPGKAGK